MVEYFDRNVSLRALIWSFPVVFLVHDSEEVLTAERFWRENRNSLPIPTAIKNRIEITTPQMASAVLCVFTIVVSASYLAAKPPIRAGTRLGFFNAAVATLFLNALQHAAQTLVIWKYTPGVVTAFGVALPYAAYTFHRLRKEGLIGRGDLRQSMKMGGVSVIPVVLSAHLAGRVFERWFRG